MNINELYNKIIGTWITGSGGLYVTMEILGDGTMKSTSEGRMMVWGYTLLNEYTMAIGARGQPDKWQIYKIELSGETLGLMDERISWAGYVVYKRVV